MIITKEKLKKQIEDFPDEIEMDEVIDRLIFLEKLEKRLKESENNEVVDDEDVVAKEIQKCFK